METLQDQVEASPGDVIQAPEVRIFCRSASGTPSVTLSLASLTYWQETVQDTCSMDW